MSDLIFYARNPIPGKKEHILFPEFTRMILRFTGHHAKKRPGIYPGNYREVIPEITGIEYV